MYIMLKVHSNLTLASLSLVQVQMDNAQSAPFYCPYIVYLECTTHIAVYAHQMSNLS